MKLSLIKTVTCPSYLAGIAQGELAAKPRQPILTLGSSYIFICSLTELHNLHLPFQSQRRWISCVHFCLLSYTRSYNLKHLWHPQFSSVQLLSCVRLLQPHGLQHARLPCPSPSPKAYSNSCPSHWWCHPNISSSAIPFFSRFQSFPASGSFPMSQFFVSGGQSIGASASTSALPMNIQDWFPLGWTGWISLQSKGLWRVFSNTTVQKHQFFSSQLSL